MKHLTLLAIVLALSFAASGQKELVELPDMEVQQLDGSLANINDLIEDDSKTIIITFARTWCAPCLTMLDNLAKEYDEMQSTVPFNLIAINVDGLLEENYEAMKQLKEERNWPFEVVVDSEINILELFEYDKAPLSLFIQNNKIIHLEHDFRLSPENFTGVFLNHGQEEQFLDENWKFTTKENASHRRTVEYNGGIGMHVTDYHSNGEVQMKGEYLSMYPKMKNGKFEYFDLNGNLTSRLQYSFGSLDGLSEEFNEDGSLDRTSNYSLGSLKGEYTYYRDGKVWSIHEYEFGKLKNVKATYDLNGNKLNTGSFKDGAGVLYNYDEKDRRVSATTYSYSKQHGSTTHFNYASEPVFQTIWYEGERSHRQELQSIGLAAAHSIRTEDLDTLKMYLYNDLLFDFYIERVDGDRKQELINAKNKMSPETSKNVQLWIEDARTQLKNAGVRKIKQAEPVVMIESNDESTVVKLRYNNIEGRDEPLILDLNILFASDRWIWYVQSPN